MQPFSADQDSPFLKAPDSSWITSNGLAFAVPDQFPVSPGHALVVTRRVVPSWFDATASEQAALMDLVNEVKRLLDARCSPKPDGYNVGFNSGSAAGQTVPHVHIHVIPRYAGDMADPRGGVRHVIPNKGNYLLPASNPSRDASLGIQDILSTGHPDSSLWSALEWRIPKVKSLFAPFPQLARAVSLRGALK